MLVFTVCLYYCMVSLVFCPRPLCACVRVCWPLAADIISLLSLQWHCLLSRGDIQTSQPACVCFRLNCTSGLFCIIDRLLLFFKFKNIMLLIQMYFYEMQKCFSYFGKGSGLGRCLHWHRVHFKSNEFK